MPIPFIVRSAKGLRLESIREANFWSKTIHGVMSRKADHVWKYIGKYVKGKKVLDVGMGSGSISYFFEQKGF